MVQNMSFHPQTIKSPGVEKRGIGLVGLTQVKTVFHGFSGWLCGDTIPLDGLQNQLELHTRYQIRRFYSNPKKIKINKKS